MKTYIATLILILHQVFDGTRLLGIIKSTKGMLLSSAALGGLCTIGYAPFSIWPCTVSSVVFMMMLLSAAKNAKTVFACLMVFFGVNAFFNISWLEHVMYNFGQIPDFISYPCIGAVSLLYIALPYAAAGALGFKLSKGKTAPFLMCFMPAGFIAADFFTSWFLTGFPWTYLGYACVDSPFKNFAPFIGLRGINALVYIFSAAVALTALRRFLFMPVAAVIMLAAILTEGVVFVQAKDPVNVYLVQANVSLKDRHNPYLGQKIVATYWNLTKDIIKKDSVVIWSEGALPCYIQSAYELLDSLNTVFREKEATLLTGIQSKDAENINNSIITLGHINSEEELHSIEHYDKRELVPFGEVIPFASLLRPLGSIFDIPQSSFTRGSQDQKPIELNGSLYTPAICYEAIFPETVASLDSDRTSGIVMISNDTWFGPTHAPAQHLNIARMRAMELQKPMLRATNSGITAYIDEKGNVVSALECDKEDVLNVSFVPVKGQSIYSKIRNIPLYLLLLVLLASGFYGASRKDDSTADITSLIRP